MTEHTPTPWRVTQDERGQVIRATDSTGRPIASMWLNGDDAKENAGLIVKAVNSHDALVKALENVRRIISEGAMTGFNYKDGDWAERLFESQQTTSAALASLKVPS